MEIYLFVIGPNPQNNININNIQIIKNIENKFIKKENKNNLGSLYELISGKVLFDIKLLLFYLDTKDEVSMIDILINKWRWIQRKSSFLSSSNNIFLFK